MSNIFTVHGHSYRRRFYFFKENGGGHFEKYTLPGGAALLAKLLKISPDMSGDSREEYFELRDFVKKEKKGERKYRASVRRLGVEGNSTVKTYGCGEYTIVCDLGLGKISLPENAKNVMWVSRNKMPPKADGIDLLFISGDVLREEGAMISKAVS